MRRIDNNFFLSTGGISSSDYIITGVITYCNFYLTFIWKKKEKLDNNQQKWNKGTHNTRQNRSKHTKLNKGR